MKIYNNYFCQACLSGKGEMSDPYYCKTCYQFMENERERMKTPDDYWTDSGMTFVHYGKKYCLTPTGRTVCAGDVAAKH